MAYTVRYANFDLVSGLNDGTSEANAWQTLSDLNTGLAAGSILCHIKKQATRPTFVNGTTFGVDAAIGAPNVIRGYGTTVGDGVRWEFGSTFGNLFFTKHTTWDLVDFSGNANLAANLKAGSTLTNSRVVNSGSVKFATQIKNYIELTGTNQVRHGAVNVGPCQILSCYIRRVGADAQSLADFDMFGMPLTVMGCIFHGNGAAGQTGITVSRHADSRGCVIAGNILHDCDNGVEFQNENTSEGRLSQVHGNLFDTMAGYAVKAPVAVVGQNRLIDNYYHACTSGFSDYADEFVDGATALTADPFVDAAGGDLTINNAAGGGALIRAAAFLTDPTGGASTTFRPLGSFLASSAGGGSPITIAHFG